MIARAAGGDNKAKRVTTCLGLILYRSLPVGTKEEVKKSIRSGEIVLSAGEETEIKREIGYHKESS